MPSNSIFYIAKNKKIYSFPFKKINFNKLAKYFIFKKILINSKFLRLLNFKYIYFIGNF